MLEAIADFWKPVKRLQAQMKLKTEELEIGSAISFGFVPQPTLSGRRFTVTAINTYKFGADILTSFVLSQERDAGVSMIIADTNGEQYIAVSRRVSISDRTRLFNHEDIEAAIASTDATSLTCKDVPADYKGWMAAHYKREIHDVKGQLYRGDHRGGSVGGQTAMDFSYTLLVSENNEQALEIEKYRDGRVEVYATVYRRMSDIAEVVHPEKKDVSRPDVKLVSGNSNVVAPNAKPEPKMEIFGSQAKAPEVKQDAPKVETSTVEAPKAEPVKAELPTVDAPKAEAPKAEPIKTEPVKFEEAAPIVKEEVVATKMALPEFSAEAVAKKFEEPTEAVPAPRTIAVSAASQAPAAPSSIIVQSSSQPFSQQEIKAVNKETSNFVNESIDCELHVANKIIDEAIRNEMRINDVVRRVIGLPVSQQESVQIPITLTDQDYALLAIRYGISSNDHDAIKKRITDDLGDFSGANKQKKAA